MFLLQPEWSVSVEKCWYQFVNLPMKPFLTKPTRELLLEKSKTNRRRFLQKQIWEMYMCSFGIALRERLRNWSSVKSLHFPFDWNPTVEYISGSKKWLIIAASCSMLDTGHLMIDAECLVLDDSWFMVHGSWFMRHASCFMLHASSLHCFMPHASWLTPRDSTLWWLRQRR